MWTQLVPVPAKPVKYYTMLALSIMPLSRINTLALLDPSAIFQTEGLRALLKKTQERPIRFLLQTLRDTEVDDSSPEASAPRRNLPYVLVWLQECIDAVYNPAEEPPIQGLGHGISDIRGPVNSVGSDDGLSSGDHTMWSKGLLELFGADAENRGSWNKR